jgi:hypothetical protein
MTTIQASMFSGDAYTQLAMMATQVDEQDRSIARETEDSADAAADQSEEQRVDEMRAQAQDTESGALAAGITGMVGGLCSVVGAFVPSSGDASGSGASTAAAARSTGLGPALDAGSKLMTSFGGLVSGVYSADASGHGAAATQDEANAQASLRQATRAHDDLQAARSSLDKVAQFLDGTQQAENAARLAAVSVRA